MTLLAQRPPTARTTADEWYDDWLARLNRRAREPRMIKQLEQERAAVRRDVDLAGERTYDVVTEQLRQHLLARHRREAAA